MDSRIGKGPLYGEIARELRARIEAGRYLESGYLPQERALADEFGVSRNTVRGALKTLQDEKLIVKIQGKGIMLAEIPEKDKGITEYVVLSYNTPTLSEFLLVVLRELERQSKEESADLVYMSLPGDTEKEILEVKKRISKRTKTLGIVLVGRYTRELLRKLRDMFTWPLVLIGDVYGTNSRSGEAIVSQVVGNDYAKMYHAADLLLKRGFRRIGVIGGSLDEIWGKAYYEGCLGAFADRNVTFRKEYYLFSAGYQNLEEATRDIIGLLIELFQNKEPPDALIFPAELTAAVQMFQKFHPELLHDDMGLVGISFDACQRDFPCIASRPSEMVHEALSLLNLELEQRCHLCQRRFINSSLLPELIVQKTNMPQLKNKLLEEVLT